MVNSETPNNVKTENGNAVALERTRMMLDATPLACRLMKKLSNGKYELFECNEESFKLFKFKSKQEFIERYFDIFPEYQPDGSVSLEAGLKLFDKAYTEGRCVSDFLFQTVDGEPIPSEVTLVRLEYGDEYILAGYTRDLREQRLMMETIENRTKLLTMGNLAVQALLSTDDNTDISAAILESLELVGRAVGGDRVQIWRNEMINGALHFIHTYEWLSDVGKENPSVPIGLIFPYTVIPRWEGYFSGGGYINGPLSELEEDERRLLGAYDIKTFVMIPLFIKKNYWGFFCVVDCVNERTFKTEEITILGAISRMLVSAINRNLQAAEIREAHDRTKLLLDTTPLAVHLWDKDLNLFDCNEESVRLFKRRDKEDYLKHFADLSPELQPDGSRSSDMAELHILRAFREGKHEFEWMHKDTDGTLIPSEITLVRVAYENDYAVAGYVRDLREQKAMMREIEQKSILLNSINQAANILLQSEIDEFESNLQICMGMIGAAVNADRMCIWKNSVINGKLHCTLVDEWIKTEQMRTSDEISTEVPYEGNIPTFERILTKGECVNALTRDLSPEEQARMGMHGIKSIFVAPVFVEGEFWGFVGCDNCHDESVFSEEVAKTLRSGSLLIANALLHNEMTLNLRLAAIELEAALTDTQKANNAKSDFLANMSHEMRTPLNAIIGLTWLSLENDNLDPDTQDNLVKTHNAGTSLLGIVNDILDISKIESGRLDLTPVKYNVASLINDSVTQNLLRIGERPIELKLSVDKNMYECLYGDELRLKQIINNLLSNAIKYTSEGEVELTIYCKREDETVWLTIEVRDTGRGIKREDLAKLFDNYTQLDTKANRQIEGTGLGLPITKRLCEMMSGSIKVESEYGAGSIFTVRLKQKYVSDAMIGPEVVSSLNGFRYSDGRRDKDIKLKRVSMPYARVLIVDDNPTNLDVARGLMKPYGMSIDCVDSGQKAIDAMSAEDGRYDAVFMDQMMPGMDGIEAAMHIRELASDYAKNIPIIALTANAVVGNEELFLSKGFQAFLSKPIDIARLDAVIRRWIRNQEKEQLGAEAGTLVISHTDSESLLRDKEVAGLDIEGGIKRFGGDEDVYINILHSYVANTRGLLDSMEAVTAEKISHYEITVHSIKGSSYGICADEVGRQAKDLEYAAKTGDFSYIGKRNKPFLEYARRFISELESMLASLESENPKDTKDKPDSSLLSNLIDACNAYDMDEVDAAMEQITSFQYEADEGLVEWLRANVELMNFSEIVEKLEEIIKAETV